MRRWQGLVLPALALMAALAFSQTEWDHQLQAWFWNAQDRSWLVDSRSPGPRLLFYDGPKIALILAGVATIGLVLAATWGVGWARPIRPWRKEFVYLAICLAAVPAIISNLKLFTDVYCPSQTRPFGGRYALVAPFHAHPETDRQEGRCFPAGHASGGYALLALGYLGTRPRYRVAGALVGLTVGTTMGLYQMAKGVHFASHTLTTMALAWLLVAALAAWLALPRPRPAGMP